jgi:UDP-N-acetylmuramoyl-L-alanyl-D-glutamate--2,6-diaminopimelate ligase/murE/murF fusion protein
MSRTLRQIVEKLTQAQWINAKDDNPSILTLAHDSRQVGPGTLFVCIRGASADGHDFAEAAVKQGAVAVLAEHPIAGLNQTPVITVPDVKAAIAGIAAWFYDDPARKLRLLAVTGTNGKTTTTHIIRDIFNQAGRPCGVIGTLHILIGDRVVPVKNTTPDVMDLQASLAEMVADGMEYVAMEVSSHALALDRVAGCEFDVAVFTNMTQDHLDFHGDLSNYREAKAGLFRLLDAADAVKAGKTAVVNLDDPVGSYMRQQTRARVIGYGIETEAAIRAADVELRPESSCFRVLGEFGEFTVQSGLTGQFNVYNMLAAVGTALAEGIAVSDIQAALKKFSRVPGRFERVAINKPFTVIVDYAHTPDGLENVLRTARQFVTGKLIAVFGCGGDRDRTKRPIMGRLAASYADRIIVTSDNPRSEEPTFIISQIMAGIETVEARGRTETIADRRQAIARAMELAGPGDVVLVAGKGHETYQILAERTIHFDDREIVRELAEE